MDVTDLKNAVALGEDSSRNPILVSYVAKGLLPYHGLGSGIRRALEQWPRIDFVDDREGCLFTVTIHRKKMEGLVEIGDVPKITPEASGKRREKTGSGRSTGYLLICDHA